MVEAPGQRDQRQGVARGVALAVREGAREEVHEFFWMLDGVYREGKEGEREEEE